MNGRTRYYFARSISQSEEKLEDVQAASHSIKGRSRASSLRATSIKDYAVFGGNDK